MMSLDQKNHLQMKGQAYLLSVVIAVYRGDISVPILCKQIKSVLQYENCGFEIILVDDGCPDKSWQVIKELCSINKKIKGIKLSRNCGQQIAISAGISQAKGDFLILMDCDLQNPPSAIPYILRELEKGNDIVYTVSKKRNNFFDEMSSKLFWFLLTKVLNVKMVKNQLMMRGMTNKFAECYKLYGEASRTVAGISLDIGMKSNIVHIENQKRYVGVSNYSFLARLNLMIDMILSLTTAPLTVIIDISLFVLLATTVISCYFAIAALVFKVPAGYTSIILAVLGFGSLITLILGILGMYLAKIYQEVRNRPLFIIDESIN